MNENNQTKHTRCPTTLMELGPTCSYDKMDKYKMELLFNTPEMVFFSQSCLPMSVKVNYAHSNSHTGATTALFLVQISLDCVCHF